MNTTDEVKTKNNRGSGLSPQAYKNQSPQPPVSKKGSFFVVASTIAGVLTILVIAAIYYANTNTHFVVH